jgi:cysteine desulfurase
MPAAAHTYLDNMASTPVDLRVIESMRPFWSESFGNPHSADHWFGWKANEAVEGAAASVACLIGADADEIVFTSGATEANNLAVLGLAHRAPKGRRRILVSPIEHKSSISAVRVAAERYGLAYEMLVVDSEGRIDIENVSKVIGDDVLCVLAMAVNNELGTVQDIPAISAICAKFGAHLISDAVQAPCAVDLDVGRDNVPLLVLSAHKLYGPKGIGALYVRRDIRNSVEPQIYGGHQQGGLRAGTLPTPLCVGFGAAATILKGEDMIHERSRIEALRNQFETGLRQLDLSIAFNGAGAQRHPGCSNTRFDGHDGRDLLSLIQPSVAGSSGSACSSGITEPSHVLRAIGLSGEDADASIRFSFGRFNAEADVPVAIGAISQALAK